MRVVAIPEATEHSSSMTIVFESNNESLFFWVGCPLEAIVIGSHSVLSQVVSFLSMCPFLFLMTISLVLLVVDSLSPKVESRLGILFEIKYYNLTQ